MLLGLSISVFTILLIIDYRRALATLHLVKLASKINLPTDTSENLLSKVPEIKGFYKGHEIRIFMCPHKENIGKFKRTKMYTAIEIKVNNPTKYKLNVYEEGLISKIGKYFGMQDIVIGHEKFDKEYIVKTNNEYITQQILSKNICDELVYMADKKFGFGFQFNPETIYYEEPLLIINETRSLLIERTLNILIALYDEFNKYKQQTF